MTEAALQEAFQAVESFYRERGIFMPRPKFGKARRFVCRRSKAATLRLLGPLGRTDSKLNRGRARTLITLSGYKDFLS